MKKLVKALTSLMCLSLILGCAGVCIYEVYNSYFSKKPKNAVTYHLASAGYADTYIASKDTADSSIDIYSDVKASIVKLAKSNSEVVTSGIVISKTKDSLGIITYSDETNNLKYVVLGNNSSCKISSMNYNELLDITFITVNTSSVSESVLKKIHAVTASDYNVYEGSPIVMFSVKDASISMYMGNINSIINCRLINNLPAEPEVDDITDTVDDTIPSDFIATPPDAEAIDDSFRDKSNSELSSDTLIDGYTPDSANTELSDDTDTEAESDEDIDDSDSETSDDRIISNPVEFIDFTIFQTDIKNVRARGTCIITDYRGRLLGLWTNGRYDTSSPSPELATASGSTKTNSNAEFYRFSDFSEFFK